MRPAWSVLFLTTLIGSGQGLFLALFALDLLGRVPSAFAATGAAIAVGLLAAGLASSFFHLGHPERAWRSAAMWRTSWLSREVIALPAFMAAVFAWGVAHYARFPPEVTLWLGAAGALLAAALFVCTGMVYACLKFLQEWHTPLTVLNFSALGCASGLTAAAALAAWLEPALARPYAAAALLAGLIAYAMRLAALARNARLRPKSTLATAIGVKHPHIVQMTQGAMGGSFNTREFFHGRPREVVSAVRWSFLALLFPLPGLLLLLWPAAGAALTAAFLVQFAGLLAERWYFFAEANHPQNLYYRAIA
ncbi:MAG TPA: DmsC/YnfH family molybdoenzyme membrane anchor subunit [Burkholderiales bacterium]|nr:DmsC/YnfH family molybdoenzyme membrane anchor subunit [Burkholderiales bacterium]